MQQIKLICTDIDGTLLSSQGTISPFDKQMISRSYKELGIPFALVSGRYRGGVTRLADQFDIPCILSCFNGSYIEVDGKVLNEVRIPTSALKTVYPLLKAYDTVPLIFDLNKWYIEDIGPYYDRQIAFSGNTGVVTPFKPLFEQWEQEQYNTYKMLAKSVDENKILELEQVLLTLNLPGIDVFRSSPYILEIVPKGTDKANTVILLAKHFKISTEQVMAFGDFTNDYNMLRVAGVSVAMGNALPSIKAIAKDVTLDNDHSGIGYSIKKYLF